MFNHKYRYLFILLLSLYTYFSTVLCRVYFFFQIEVQWYYALLTISSITFAIWELNRLLERYFKKSIYSHSNKLKSLLLFFVAGNVVTTCITILIVMLVSNLILRQSFSETLIPLKLNIIYAWLANLLFHLLNAVVFYLTEYKTKLLEAETFKRMSSQAELQIIKNQINPHFLFNNLNVLSSLILQNNAEANRFIEAFSQVYRYILKNNDTELVSLEDEMHHIHPYIFLLQKRFTEGLKISFQIDHPKRLLLMVPASLQILIENAIKHNIVSTKRPLYIKVHSDGNDSLIVSNNRQARLTNEKSTGIGLKNIIKRYSIVSNREVTINSDDSFFSVTIPLIQVN